MGVIDSFELAWRGSHHGAVHAVLTACLDAGIRRLPPGAEGVIGRAQSHFQRIGDQAALARLEAISITVFKLQQARLPGAAFDHDGLSGELAERTQDWLMAAPMFPADPPLELVA